MVINNNSYGQLVTDLQRAHYFAHEFGHGMGIAHHFVCGESVMTGDGCEDMVHGPGPYPNDICWPLIWLYYPDSAQQCD